MSAELHESRYISREEFLRRKVAGIEFTSEPAPKIDVLSCVAVGVATLSASVAAYTWAPELDQGALAGTVDYVRGEIQSTITGPFEKIIMALD